MRPALLKPKPDKNTTTITKRKPQANIFDEHKGKNHQNDTSKPTPRHIKMIAYHDQEGCKDSYACTNQ